MESEKQRKIDTILALMRGELSPEDINPRLELLIGYEENNICLINGKRVDQEKFDAALRLPPAPGEPGLGFLTVITYGKENESMPDEIYI